MQSKIRSALFQAGIIGLVGLGTVGLVIFLFKTRPVPSIQERPPLVISVRTQTIHSQPTTMTVTDYGTVRAERPLQYVARVSGELVQLSPHLHAGDYFQRGELLMTIDPNFYQLAVDELSAILEQARIELERLTQVKENDQRDLEIVEQEVELAFRDVERRRKLVSSRVDTAAELERSEQTWLAVRSRAQAVRNRLSLWPAQFATAQSKIAQLESQLEKARLNLSYCRIEAQFDGRVLERQVEQGQYVNVGAALIKVYDPRRMEIPVQMRWEDFRWLDTSTLTEDTSPADAPVARIFSDDGTTLYATGYVIRLAPQISETARTLGVVVRVDAPASGSASLTNPPIIPGLYVRVAIEGRSIDRCFIVPRQAVYHDRYVYVAEGDTLARRAITVLRQGLDDMTYVESGLKEGDSIIVSPLANPIEGVTVRIENGD